MPLGIQRLNVRRRQPNSLINFITPLDGDDKDVAQDLLERIAAIVYPIMRDNGLAVMSLDEFPANTEFWGRNFNAGECIQLVLKNPHTGLWLPFKFVQGVMIHELAHIKQMNHSRAFWAVRNAYAKELTHLHARNYTGEGFWSTGRTLLSGKYTEDAPLAESDMPKNICGGTYKTPKRARKPAAKKPSLSRSEQKKRRIERKFGSREGIKVGADESQRQHLEEGRRPKPTPKVAASKRGRDLRAAAALKRFEAQREAFKQEEADPTTESTASGTESDTESDTESEVEGSVSIDVGRGIRKYMIPICPAGAGTDEDSKERLELITGAVESTPAPGESSANIDTRGSTDIKPDTTGSKSPRESSDNTSSASAARPQDKTSQPTDNTNGSRHTSTQIIQCGFCTMENSRTAVTCGACMNVLSPTENMNVWSCSNTGCALGYRNSGDLRYCGVCFQKRQTPD